MGHLGLDGHPVYVAVSLGGMCGAGVTFRISSMIAEAGTPFTHPQFWSVCFLFSPFFILSMWAHI